MNITKILLCAVSVANIGFAGEISIVDAFGDSGLNHSVTAQPRIALGDITNTGTRSSTRVKRPISSINTDYIYDESAPKLFKIHVATSSIASEGSDLTTAENTASSLASSLTSSRATSRAASPVAADPLLNDAEVFSVFSFGFLDSNELNGAEHSSDCSFASSQAISPVAAECLSKEDVKDLLNSSIESLGLEDLEDPEGFLNTSFESLGLGEQEEEQEDVIAPGTPDATPVAAVVSVQRTPAIFLDMINAAAQDATPFENGGTYKGCIYPRLQAQDYCDLYYATVAADINGSFTSDRKFIEKAQNLIFKN
jgi:hypothetical protein